MAEGGTRDVTIRFPQVDPAGIVFYARYFELVSRYFPDVALTDLPLGIETQFLKPNRFGDRIELRLDDGEDWCITGRMNDDVHFSMQRAGAGKPGMPSDFAYRTKTEQTGRWCTGADGRMQLSRYFEFLNMAIEEWFETTLDLPFADLHKKQRIGIPTVRFDTRVFGLPAEGDRFFITFKPERLGKRSMTFTSCMVSDGRCLVENRQVVVFVRMQEDAYVSTDIPDTVRVAFDLQANS